MPTPTSTTEVASLPFKHGLNINNPCTPEHAAWNSTVAGILDQNAAQRLFWGFEEENPDVLRMFIEWDSFEDHMRFVRSPDYHTVIFNLSTLLAAPPPPTVFHVDFSSSDSTTPCLLRAPVTEITTLYFPATLDPSTAATALQNIIDNSSNLRAGWTVEELVDDKVKRGGAEKEKPLVVLAPGGGGQAGSSAVGEGMGGLGVGEKPRARDVVHVRFKEEVRGGFEGFGGLERL